MRRLTSIRPARFIAAGLSALLLVVALAGCVPESHGIIDGNRACSSIDTPSVHGAYVGVNAYSWFENGATECENDRTGTLRYAGYLGVQVLLYRNNVRCGEFWMRTNSVNAQVMTGTAWCDKEPGRFHATAVHRYFDSKASKYEDFLGRSPDFYV